MTRRYLAAVYLRYFIIIFFALELFYLGIDFLQNAKNLPDSTNLVVLYLAFMSVAAMKVTLPLSLIFGAVGAFVYLVRSNELVALYALGYTKRRVLAPLITVSMAVTAAFVALSSTPAAYYADRAASIADDRYFSTSTSDLFFKLDSTLIYMGRLHPLVKQADDVRIFRFRGDELIEAIYAKEGRFIHEKWILYGVLRMIPDAAEGRRLAMVPVDHLEVLPGFRPKLLDNIFEGKGSFSVADALNALILLHDQSINLEKVRTALYAQALLPFFAPIAVIFLFVFFPASGRFFNLVVVMIGSIIATLLAWGILLVLQSLAMGGSGLPELLLVLPMIALGAAAAAVVAKSG